MKWFRHKSTANMDAKLQEVMLDHGLEGYGLYWYCIELIASEVESENLTFELEHDARVIARNTGSTVDTVNRIMSKFIDLGLFEADYGVITCLKLSKVADDYTSKFIRKNPQAIDNKRVRQSPTKSDKNNTDKIKLDNIKQKDINPLIESEIQSVETVDVDVAFDLFWSKMHLAKKAKSVAIKAFKKAVKTANANDPVHFANHLINDTKKRSDNKQLGFDKMHPSTYLNQTRWEDEYTVDEQQKRDINAIGTNFSEKPAGWS